jgi:hypothetical protein
MAVVVHSGIEFVIVFLLAALTEVDADLGRGGLDGAGD